MSDVVRKCLTGDGSELDKLNRTQNLKLSSSSNTAPRFLACGLMKERRWMIIWAVTVVWCEGVKSGISAFDTVLPLSNKVVSSISWLAKYIWVCKIQYNCLFLPHYRCLCSPVQGPWPPSGPGELLGVHKVCGWTGQLPGLCVFV